MYTFVKNQIMERLTKYTIIAVECVEQFERSLVLSEMATSNNGVYINMPTADLDVEKYEEQSFFIIDNFHINSHLNPIRLQAHLGKPVIIAGKSFHASDLMYADIPVYSLNKNGETIELELVG